MDAGEPVIPASAGTTGWFDRLTKSGLPTHPRDASTTLGMTGHRPTQRHPVHPHPSLLPSRGKGLTRPPTPCPAVCAGLRMRASAPRVWIPASAGMTRARAARFLPPQERRGWFDRLTMSGHQHTSPRTGTNTPKRCLGYARNDRPSPYPAPPRSPPILALPHQGEGTNAPSHTLPRRVRRTAHARVCAARLDSSLRWNDEGQGCEVPASAGTTGMVRQAHHERAPTHLTTNGHQHTREMPRLRSA